MAVEQQQQQSSAGKTPYKLFAGDGMKYKKIFIRFAEDEDAPFNSFLYHGGRPDELPDEIDVILWGKLSYHTDAAVRTITELQSSTAVSLLFCCYMLVFVVLCYFLLFVQMKKKTTEIIICVVLIMLYIPAIYFSINVVLAWFGYCESQHSKRLTQRTDILVNMVHEKLKIPFLEVGYAIEYDEINDRLVIHEASTVDVNKTLERLEAQPLPPILTSKNTKLLATASTIFEDDMTVVEEPENIQLKDIPPLFLCGDVRPSEMVTLHSSKFPEGTKFDDDHHNEMVFGVIREIISKNCQSIENSQGYLSMFLICVCVLAVASLLDNNDEDQSFVYIEHDVGFILLICAASFLFFIIMSRVFYRPKKIQIYRNTTESELSELILQRYGYQLEYRVESVEPSQGQILCLLLSDTEIHFIKFKPIDDPADAVLSAAEQPRISQGVPC